MKKWPKLHFQRVHRELQIGSVQIRGFAFGIWRKTTHEYIFAKDRLEPREISVLVDAGLASESMAVAINTGPSIDAIFVFSYGSRLLRTRLQPTATETYNNVTSLSLTRAGRQIASVLTPRVDYEYFVAVGEWLANLLGSNVVVDWRDESSEDWIAFVNTCWLSHHRPVLAQTADLHADSNVIYRSGRIADRDNGTLERP